MFSRCPPNRFLALTGVFVCYPGPQKGAPERPRGAPRIPKPHTSRPQSDHFSQLFLSGRKSGPKASQIDPHSPNITPKTSSRHQKCVKTASRTQRHTQSATRCRRTRETRHVASPSPTHKHIEVRRCRVSVLNKLVRSKMVLAVACHLHGTSCHGSP